MRGRTSFRRPTGNKVSIFFLLISIIMNLALLALIIGFAVHQSESQDARAPQKQTTGIPLKTPEVNTPQDLPLLEPTPENAELSESSVKGTTAKKESKKKTTTATKKNVAPKKDTSESLKATTKAPEGITHTVVSGDTVYALAGKYGSKVSEIITANNLNKNASIRVGQKLFIPNGKTPAPTKSEPVSTTPKQKSATLDAEQIENVKLIISVGRTLNVSDRGIAIALATAMVESWIRNLDWGDRDSLGLFQQRPSSGWGTAEQIRDRERSIRAFFGGPNDPNGNKTRGLLDYNGWEKLDFGAAAQKVQISAHPDRYGQWEEAAFSWVKKYG